MIEIKNHLTSRGTQGGMRGGGEVSRGTQGE